VLIVQYSIQYLYHHTLHHQSLTVTTNSSSSSKPTNKPVGNGIETYQDDSEWSDVVEAFEISSVDCPVFYPASLRHHRFHHQSLTDCQRSEKIRPTAAAAAATNQSSWSSGVKRLDYSVYVPLCYHSLRMP